MTIVDDDPSIKMAADIDLQKEARSERSAPKIEGERSDEKDIHNEETNDENEGSTKTTKNKGLGNETEDNRLKDLTEEDLGIFEDEGECDELTDSDLDLDIKSNDTHSDGYKTPKAKKLDVNGRREEPGIKIDTVGEASEGRETNKIGIEVNISRRSVLPRDDYSSTLTPRSFRLSGDDQGGTRGKTNTPVSNFLEDFEEDSLER